MLRLKLGLCAAALWVPLSLSAADGVDFQRQIRPILSENCFHCHGPDKETRMAGLRLDERTAALAVGKRGAAIVPGNADESLLVKRIFASEPRMQMPPAYSHRTLTPEQKELLRTWIAQGAPWKEQWAFVAPVRPTPPSVRDASWVRNPVDAFVLAKLESAGLQPAPEADRRTLIRRLTLDLTGLPPAPDEVEAFVNDRSPASYEKTVERLLGSAAFGEHRARYWLDAARYADSHGLHMDNYREMWPYRDWVIRAFNTNMPFDKFTVEQIAGDLLPNPTLDQLVATGFHRCNVSTNEGGSIPEEVATMYAKDRVDTTSTVFMGLTVGCATCHDHKFDPIAQKDFYALAAFFRNTTQNPMDGNIPDSPPVLIVPRGEDRQRWEQVNTERSAQRKILVEARASRLEAFDTWLKALSPAAFDTVIADAMRIGETKILEVPLSGAASFRMNGVTSPVSAGSGVTLKDGAMFFEKDSSLSLPNVSAIESDQPFTIAASVYLPKKGGRVIASQFEPEPPVKPADGRDLRRGWILEIGSQGPSIKLVGADGKYLSAKPGPGFKIEGDQWYDIAFTYDGSRQREGLAIYLNGKLVPSIGTGDDVEPLLSSVRTHSPLLFGRDKKNDFEGGAIADFRVLGRRLEEQDAELLSLRRTLSVASHKAPAELDNAGREALLTYYLYQRDETTRTTAALLRKLDADWRDIARRGATTLTMQERAGSKPMAHILYRGQYDQPKEEVEPNTPSALPPMAASLPRNRLGLARWIVDPANPATARVTVNRFWQEVFGTGIVKTTEDFGSQGEVPVNPELLDWLAVEFRDSGWDVKKFFRTVVLSSTYRQSPVVTPEKVSKDPDNRLLSRGPRFRMDGEVVRDCALAASGLLVSRVGGPSVKPYQPEKIWETVAMTSSNTRFYQQDHADKLYRRSLYTFWKRSAPPPAMDIFNAPSRESCTVRRERTDTPLQALVTMNDPQFVEAARHLAQVALVSRAKTLDGQINFIAVRLLARPFDARELTIAKRSYQDYLGYYDSHPKDATKLLKTGESKPDPRVSQPELAAMTMVASQILNLDEALNK